MKNKDFKELQDFIKIRITDSESVKIRKKVINEFLEEGKDFKKDNFKDISRMMLLNVTFMNLMRLLSPLKLKIECIKNYILYIENQALSATEIEKQELRIKWRACNRWLKAIESTGNFKIPTPIELLEE